MRLWPPLGTANLQLPCGKCVGCRVARAQEWALRCQHEAGQWRDNWFLTLTYRDAPKELVPRDAQPLHKQLRKFVPGVRYFMCGEYGENNARPHFHFILFNCPLPTTGAPNGLLVSPLIDRVWKLGFHVLGSCTPAACNYVAQYTLKKIGVDDDGVVRQPPFARMSLKPPIGATWLAKYSEDLRHGFLVVDGRRQKVPRTYVQSILSRDAKLAEQIKYRAYFNRVNNKSDASTPERLADAERIHLARKQLVSSRSL